MPSMSCTLPSMLSMSSMLSSMKSVSSICCLCLLYVVYVFYVALYVFIAFYAVLHAALFVRFQLVTSISGLHWDQPRYQSTCLFRWAKSWIPISSVHHPKQNSWFVGCCQSKTAHQLGLSQRSQRYPTSDWHQSQTIETYPGCLPKSSKHFGFGGVKGTLKGRSPFREVCLGSKWHLLRRWPWMSRVY